MLIEERCRLTDVESRLKNVEAEGTEIRDEIKEARDAFLAVKKKRWVSIALGAVWKVLMKGVDVICSTRRSTISPSGSMRCIRG